MGKKIAVTTDLEWGQSFYIKNDPEQDEYHLVGVRLDAGTRNLMFKLRHMSYAVWVYDFECAPGPDILKRQRNENKEDEEE